MKFLTLLIAVAALLMSIISILPKKGIVDKRIEKYISENPKQIVDSVNKMFAEEQQKAEKKHQEEADNYIKTNYAQIVQNSPVIGSPNAKVSIIEFLDYNCGYCKIASETIKDIVREYDGKVNLVIKELPILAPTSEEAAAAALAIYITNPAKFAEMHDKLLSQKNLTSESIIKLATSYGIKAAELKDKMNSDEVKKIISESRNHANGLKIGGTPAFLIGNQNGAELIGGLATKEKFKEIIDKKLAA